MICEIVTCEHIECWPITVSGLDPRTHLFFFYEQGDADFANDCTILQQLSNREGHFKHLKFQNRISIVSSTFQLSEVHIRYTMLYMNNYNQVMPHVQSFSSPNAITLFTPLSN